MENRRRKKSGKKTETRVLLPKRTRNWISYLIDEIVELFDESDKAIDETKQK